MIAVDPPVRILTFALEPKGPSTQGLLDVKTSKRLDHPALSVLTDIASDVNVRSATR